MNEFLAEMYGTRETIGAGSADDVEKLAEAQILSEELAAEGYDASQLPDETLMKVAYELWGEDSALVKAAQEDMEEEDEEEGEEEGEKKEGSFETKVAEADFLGRVMAHSFVNEQSELDKEAGKAEAIRAGLGKALGAVKGSPKALADKYRAMKTSYGRGKYFQGNTKTMKIPSTKAGLKRLYKEHKKTLIGGGAGLVGAAGLGTAAALSGGKKKKGSALDALAEQRATEMLQEISPSQGHLKEAVDQRALEMLEAAGYLEG